MKNYLLLILIFASTSAVADMEGRLAGTWKSEGPVYELEDSLVFLDVTFKPASVALTAKCVFSDGQVLLSTVETKAAYALGSINALESKDNVTQNGARQCPILTRPTQIDYEFKSDTALTVNYRELGMVIKLTRQ